MEEALPERDAGNGERDLRPLDALAIAFIAGTLFVFSIWKLLKSLGAYFWATVVACVLAAGWFYAFGCGGGGGGEERVAAWDHLVGYGPADTWHTLDEQEFARLLWRNGLTLTGIEWVPSLQERPDCSCHMDDGRCGTLGTYPEKAAAWIASMAARGITTLVTINANECLVQRASDEWFEAQIRSIVEAAGPNSPSVILMPLSEPGELGDIKKAGRWFSIARGLWSGRFAVTEYFRKIPHDFVDQHWCGQSYLEEALSDGPRNWINSTDCPGMFQLDPASARSAALASAAGGTVLYIYADKFQGPHEPIIEALRP